MEILTNYTSDVYLAPQEPTKLTIINLDIKMGNKIKRYNPEIGITFQDYHKIIMLTLTLSSLVDIKLDTEYYIKENGLEKYFYDIENQNAR